MKLLLSPFSLTILPTLIHLMYSLQQPASITTTQLPRPKTLSSQSKFSLTPISSSQNNINHQFITIKNQQNHDNNHYRDVILCADFDNTITTKDTIEFLVRTAINSPIRQDSDKNIHEIWSNVLDIYKERTEAVLTKYKLLSTESDKEMNDSSSDNDILFLEKELYNFLNEYHTEEGVSIRILQKEKLLYGLSIMDIEHNIPNLIVENYLDSYFTTLLSTKYENRVIVKHLHVISLNWSCKLIQSVLNKINCSDNMSIHANELKFSLLKEDDSYYSNGKIDVDVQTAIHKLHRIDLIRQKHQETEHDSILIYVGDSISDLLALCQADVGFVINRKNKQLHRLTASKFGVELYSLAKVKAGSPTSCNGSTVIYSLPDLVHISAFYKKEKKRVLFEIESWEVLTLLLQQHNNAIY